MRTKKIPKMIDDYFLIRYDYRRRFLCLHCKKSIELPNVSQIADGNGDGDLLLKAFSKYITNSEKNYLNTSYFDVEHYCPCCQRPMIQIPLDYKVPPKRAFLKWKRIHSFFKAKGYVRNYLPFGKEDFKKLLKFELECTKYRLNNLSYFTYINESFQKAEQRLTDEIRKISVELQKLR